MLMREVQKKHEKNDNEEDIDMICVPVNVYSIALSSLVVLLLLTGLASQAFAAQINASLIPEFDLAVGSFVGVKFVQLRYEPESSMSELFNGRTERIEFSIDGTN